MAMFDKTFPTLDCAACILTPKMVAVGKHPQIDLMVLSEVQEVSGEPGAYRVRVLRHATRVDASACVACNECAQFCPVSVPSEFDAGIATRKAIYIPFPQAVPNAYVVDPAACTWVRSDGKKCGACAKKCAKDAVQLDARDEEVELEVGNIIVATGYQPFDARRVPRYGYGRLPNVLTALEFERLSNASGPTGGKIVLATKKLDKRTKAEVWAFEPDGPPPRAVAIVPLRGIARPQPQPVVLAGLLHVLAEVRAPRPREAAVGDVLRVLHRPPRLREGYQEFLERVEEEDVHVVRGRTAEVIARDNRLLVRGEDVRARRLVEEPVDMVLLAVGLEPSDATAELAGKLGLRRGRDGWLEELSSTLDPSSTERGGIFVAGVCQGPKDIPDTVAQASAAAGHVLRSILSGATPRGRSTLGLAEIDVRARSLAPVELDGPAPAVAPAHT